MTTPSSAPSGPRRRGFRETLVRVLAIQAVALLALFLLQYCYHAA